MDGAKSITDTVDMRKHCDRQALWQGRSKFEKIYGPVIIEDPGGSRNIVQLESAPLKGQGFLGNVNQPRVRRS